jgi:D-3-phosphoglycerate dehydrogenase
MRVLLTTTSFQDTPGLHHRKLEDAGWEIVKVRGPLDEPALIESLDGIDACICGDDAFSRKAIESAPRLRCISKYGIGLDRIDLAACTDAGIPVLYTPGVNHVTVAEHVFLLILALHRKLIEHAASTRAGEWKRLTGSELNGKSLGIIGLGRIGSSVARLGQAFGMRLFGHGQHWDEDFARSVGLIRTTTPEELYARADVISLCTRLTPRNRGMIDAAAIDRMKPGVKLVNCARGGLVQVPALVAALRTGQIGGYAADVLEEEPPPPDHPLLREPNCIITPHIASRTVENVVRQACAAIENLSRALSGREPLAQANPEVSHCRAP